MQGSSSRTPQPTRLMGKTTIHRMQQTAGRPVLDSSSNSDPKRTIFCHHCRRFCYKHPLHRLHHRGGSFTCIQHTCHSAFRRFPSWTVRLLSVYRLWCVCVFVCVCSQSSIGELIRNSTKYYRTRGRPGGRRRPPSFWAIFKGQGSGLR